MSERAGGAGAPAPETPHTIPLTSGLGSRTARLAMLFVWATGCVQVAILWPQRSGPVLLLACGLTLAGAVALTMPGTATLPGWRAALVAAVPVANAVLVLPGMTSVAQGTWLLDIGSYLAGLLMVRGHLALGWAGGGGLLGGLAWWIAVHRPPAEDAVALLVQPAIALVVGTVWHLSLRTLIARVTAHRAAGARAALERRAALSAAERAHTELVAIAELTGPLLSRIASGELLGADDRHRALLLEASLRDRLRAPGLAREPLARAVARARERGVEVLLLEDRREAPPLGPESLAVVANLVDAAPSGSITVRALPPGRRHLLSVLVDADGVHTRHDLDG